MSGGGGGGAPEGDGAAMRVFLWTLTGKTVELWLQRNETVSSLKAKIQDKEGVPLDQQRLVFSGKRLEDGRTLADYNIVQDCKLYLML